MQTITITLAEYLAIFPEPERWIMSSPGEKEIQPKERNMIHTLYGNCNFRGPEINIPKICKNVVQRSQKSILSKPYYLIYVASRIIQKGPFVSYSDCFELVMWHMVNELNARYKAERLPITVELGGYERDRAGLND
ncbi:hypothetical protein GO730_05640 [Spirosoma sp. HMF3257]|uniref:Uncharacterized protein n=1 Tax=Spirosoma telluris TaxID=2183553 RepID=A0A327NMX7_9BACT|nr:hypothetical protein [Spirosoma telluris]RAI73958.1 hypothetical protein HMF3257_05600 [Spirosoma telluris]